MRSAVCLKLDRSMIGENFIRRRFIDKKMAETLLERAAAVFF